MRGAKLTKRAVDAAQAGQADVFLWDAELRGFGLKVTPAGRKVYVVQYRRGKGRGAPTKRETIGEHGAPCRLSSGQAVPSLTPEVAREDAKRRLARAWEGGADDPKAPAPTTPDGTVAAVIDRFILEYATPRQRTWRETKRQLDHYIRPAWGSRPIRDVTAGDVLTLLDGIVAAGHGTTANRVHSIVRRMLRWAGPRYGLEGNPAAGLGAPAPTVNRDRVLTDTELALVWRAAEALDYPFGPFVRLLILTLQRRDECAGIVRSELDWSERLWLLPSARAKNGDENAVPLSDPAFEILWSLPWHCDLAFTTTGKTPVSGFSKAKARLDQEVTRLRIEQAKAAGLDPHRLPPMPPWRLHDLRRTGTTGLASLGCDPHIPDAILNHRTGSISGVARIYNRFKYLAERRAALDAWAAHVLRIVGERTPDNVIQLRRPAAG